MHIGPALAEARTEAGMTVEDVSERTRIRRAIISDIERDDYASCGGDFYARGHIRAIAKVVGADPVPLIEEYDESMAARDAPELATGPDPGDWLRTEGSAEPLLWRPHAAGPGPDTWPAPPPDVNGTALPPGTRGTAAPPPGGEPPTTVNGTASDGDPVPMHAGADTAPQQVIPAPWRPARSMPGTGWPAARSAPSAAGALRDAAAGAGRAGTAAMQRAADRLRRVRLEAGGRLRGGPGPGGPGQMGGAVTDVRRAGAGAMRWMSRLRAADRGASRIIGGLAIILGALILVLYGIFSGPAHGAPRPATSPRHPASGRPSPAHRAADHGAAAHRAGAAQSRPAAVPLRPARVVAFGPGGAGDGDNPQRAAQALRPRGGGWHTNWYTTARFGGLQPGTGLLLDMGRTVAVSRAVLRLGPGAGAEVQLRVGGAPALPGLRPVAQAVSHGGRLLLAPPQPARGRYVLIWFIRLPRDDAGTYQAAISGITITGARTSG